MNPHYPRVALPVCPRCDSVADLDMDFCPKCGRKRHPDREPGGRCKDAYEALQRDPGRRLAEWLDEIGGYEP